MYLMLKDTEVLYFDIEDSFEIVILKRELLPFGLRAVLRSNDKSFEDIIFNLDKIKDWLASRTLSLHRDNAKLIYNMFNINQRADRQTNVDICLMCKGVSITDSYWLREDASDLKWEDVNLRTNSFKDIVNVSLMGDNPSFTVNPICPELTNKGLFRKAWICEEGKLFLLKSDKHISNVNTRMEVLASKVLDCFTNVKHVNYTSVLMYDNTYTSKCENFVTEDFSFVEAYDVMAYCSYSNIDYVEFALRKFGSDFANIAVIDYILMNTDRHTSNYGFMMDNTTGELMHVAPLFDHNLSLVSDVFGNNIEDTLSQMLNTSDSILEVAKMFFEHACLKFDYNKFKEIRKDFEDVPQVYSALTERIENLYEKLH